MELNNTDPMEIIRILHKGHMMSQRAVKSYVQQALVTEDFRSLIDFLDSNPVIYRQALLNIKQDQLRKLDYPFEEVSHDDVRSHMSGPLKVGYVNKHDDMFGMYPDDLSMLGIVPGRAGSGKSTLFKRFILEYMNTDSEANLIIPDLKREYRGLLRVQPDFKVIGGQYLKINPLESPAWIGLKEFIIFFAKVFTRQNWILATSENILLETLEYIYKKRGIFNGSQDWPKMIDLYRVITKRLESQKSFRFRDVLMLLQNRIYPYTECPVFDCRKGIPDDHWRTFNFVLELDEGFTDNMYSFLVSFQAGLRYMYNKKHGLGGSKLRTLFLIDEGRTLFDANRNTSDFGESYINELSTKTRENGIGYLIASQESSSFNQTIRANAYTKFAFPLTDGADRDFIKESFGLNQDQADYLFKLPKHGICVARYGGYENPFLLGVPPVNLGSQVTDREVESLMAEYYRQLDYTIKDSNNIKNNCEIINPPTGAIALLHFLVNEPFTKSSELKKAPGFKSQTEVAKAIFWLESGGYVQRQSYRVSRKGRKAHFIVLTSQAFTNFNLQHRKGKGDFEHQLYQHLICEQLKQSGFEARIEGRLQKARKSVDVLSWDKDGQVVAYEVTLQLKNLEDNIRLDFAGGAFNVVIVCRDQLDIGKAKEVVEMNETITKFREHVSFSLISDFFN